MDSSSDSEVEMKSRLLGSMMRSPLHHEDDETETLINRHRSTKRERRNESPQSFADSPSYDDTDNDSTAFSSLQSLVKNSTNQFTHSAQQHYHNIQNHHNYGGRNNTDHKYRRTSSMSSAEFLENDVEETNIQQQLFSTLDKFEDEFDEQAYEELIPLRIRLALEQQVFGWTHFSSEVLGHVVFTLSSYFLTFWLVSVIGLKYIGSASPSSSSSYPYYNPQYSQFYEDNNYPITSIDTEECGWECFLHKVNYKGADYHYHQYYYAPILNIPPPLFIFLRYVLSMSSGLSAFRTVRRRRMVWIRPRTSRLRRRNLRETDRTTLLGRLRSGVARKKNLWLSKRVQKKINKATNRFEKRQERTRRRRRRKFVDGDESYEKEHHERVMQLSRGNPGYVADNGEGDNGDSSSGREDSYFVAISNSSGDEDFGEGKLPHGRNKSIVSGTFYDGDISPKGDNTNNSDGIWLLDNKTTFKKGRKDIQRERTRSVSMSDLSPEDFLETFQRHENYDARVRHERKTLGGAAHFRGHTMPAFAMQSIAHDQIRFKNGLIQNVAYAHGGYFGAAPFMLANPHWINILRHLMPDVYVELSRRVVHTPVPNLIHWAENNPVVAAYGTAHELEYFGKVSTVEWDVFLDPHLVQRVEIVLEAREKFLKDLPSDTTSGSTAISGNDANGRNLPSRFTDKMDALERSLTTDERSILHFFNTEIKKRLNVLIESMLIAHGNASQLVMEQTGYLKQFNFSRVKHTRRTLGGGIYAKHWITIYAKALKMSTDFDFDLWAEEESIPYTESSFDPLSPPMSPRQKYYDNDNREDAPFVDESGGLMQMDSRDDNEVYSKFHDKDPLLSSFHKEETQLKHSTSLTNLTNASGSSTSISESITMLKKIMNCEAPLGLVLDIKSRFMPKRIWALIVDNLRAAGARVEGVASFCVDEIRDISQYCSAPVNDMIFFHTAGDIQKACHDGLIRKGDRVFFNGGSLFWNYPDTSYSDFFRCTINTALFKSFDAEEFKKNYKFQSYARIAGDPASDGQVTEISENHRPVDGSVDSRSSTSDEEKNRSAPRRRILHNTIQYRDGYGSTIEQYKEAFDLSIGVYVQEFAIDEKSIDLIVKYINLNHCVYNLGLSWGGINGVTVRGIQPGRFTNTDGLWNQRYTGARWDTSKFPHSVGNGTLS